jgi:hypothetical protein
MDIRKIGMRVVLISIRGSSSSTNEKLGRRRRSPKSGDELSCRRAQISSGESKHGDVFAPEAVDGRREQSVLPHSGG